MHNAADNPLHGTHSDDADRRGSPIKKRQRALLWIGSLGPLGHLPASGTCTVAVVGLPLFYVTSPWPLLVRVLSAIALTAAAVWVHHVGDRILGQKDSRKLVWDELAGYMIATTMLPFSWPAAAAAFVIERIIDIVKVPPARWIERTWPGGWGVVGDDVVAGLYTYLLLLALARAAAAAGLGA
jgi:phosphatidylglycerophosphatase A